MDYLTLRDAVPSDLARVEMEEIQIGLSVDGVESLRNQALLALAEAVGASRLKIGTLEGKLDEALELPSLQSVLDGLSKHATLEEAKVAIQAQSARIDLARAERIPDVNLELFYRHIGETETNAFDVGFSVGLPVFGRNQGKLRELHARLRQSEEDLRSRRNRLEREHREAYLNLEFLMAKARSLKNEILPRAEKVQTASEARYSAGDISLGDTLVIRRERRGVELAYLETLRAMMEEWATLRVLIVSEEVK